MGAFFYWPCSAHRDYSAKEIKTIRYCTYYSIKGLTLY